MDMPITLIVMVSWLYAYVPTPQIVYIKHVLNILTMHILISTLNMWVLCKCKYKFVYYI